MVRYIFWLRPVINDEVAAVAPPRQVARRATPMVTNNPAAEAVPAFAGAPREAAASAPALSAPVRSQARSAPQPARTGGDDVIKTVKREEPKVGRNDPCPCGSGKKYKKCHGQAA